MFIALSGLGSLCHREAELELVDGEVSRLQAVHENPDLLGVFLFALKLPHLVLEGSEFSFGRDFGFL